MNIEAKIKLHKIGTLLDRRKFEQIRIHNSGIVETCEITGAVSTQAKEKNHEQQRPRRSESKSWAGPQAWQGTSDRPGASHTAPQNIRPDLQVTYEAGLGEACEAFPNCQIWRQNEGILLLSESSLLVGLRKKAKFLTWFPLVNAQPVRSWGFWDGDKQMLPKWIGPRHTNYDGSICAFEPRDGTWVAGNRIVNLLDLYTLWAVRQLHLEVFGRWPGDQIARHHHERLTELRGDEFCGCGETYKRYSECCYLKDLNAAKNDDEFMPLLVRGEQRIPPVEVQNFIFGYGEVPTLEELRINIFKKYVANNPRLSTLLRLF